MNLGEPLEVEDPLPLITVASVCYTLLLLGGLLVGFLWIDQFVACLCGAAPLVGLLHGLGAGTVLVLGTWGLVAIWPPMALLEQELRRVFLPCTSWWLLFLAIVSSAAEEVIFRGLLQPNLGFVLTSILFGAVHFVPRATLFPWTLFALVAGFVLGWLFEETEGLIAPVIAHSMVNSINLMVLQYRSHGRGAPSHVAEQDKDQSDR